MLRPTRNLHVIIIVNFKEMQVCFEVPVQSIPINPKQLKISKLAYKFKLLKEAKIP